MRLSERVPLALLALCLIVSCSHPGSTAAAPRSAHGQEVLPSGELVDLMPSFWSFWTEAQGQDRAAQTRLFRERVVATHPEAFTPDVLDLDGADPTALDHRIARWLDHLPPHIDRMRAVDASLRPMLAGALADFRRTFPDFTLDIPLYVMPSLDSFDGGTRTIGGRAALALGVDVIASAHREGASLRPFFAHELFHVYHHHLDAGHPDTLEWALWEEGLATYVSKTLNPGATDDELAIGGDLVPRARAALPRLAGELRRALDSTSEETYAEFFLGGSTPSGLPSRSGYYVGMLVAEKLAKGRTLAELARLRDPELRRVLDAVLAELEQTAPSSARAAIP